MNDPYIQVLPSSAGECAVHTVTASCGKRLLRRKRYCMVEKTSVPRVELVRGTGRERAVYTFACVWFEFVLVALTCNISWSLWETRL